MESAPRLYRGRGRLAVGLAAGSSTQRPPAIARSACRPAIAAVARHDITRAPTRLRASAVPVTFALAMCTRPPTSAYGLARDRDVRRPITSTPPPWSFLSHFALVRPRVRTGRRAARGRAGGHGAGPDHEARAALKGDVPTGPAAARRGARPHAGDAASDGSRINRCWRWGRRAPVVPVRTTP